jgi:hypothetical protein
MRELSISTRGSLDGTASASPAGASAGSPAVRAHHEDEGRTPGRCSQRHATRRTALLPRAAAAIVALAGVLLSACPSSASPVEGSITQVSASGEVRAEIQGTAQVRDVFAVYRGSKGLGEIMVTRVQASSLTVLPKASFQGQLQRGDHIVFVRHANTPRDRVTPPSSGHVSAGPKAGSPSGATPSSTASTSQRADVIENPISVTPRSEVTPRGDGSSNINLVVELRNDSTDNEFRNVIVELQSEASLSSKTTRNAGNLAPGQKTTLKWPLLLESGKSTSAGVRLRYKYGDASYDKSFPFDLKS